jgi:hypothetical protein
LSRCGRARSAVTSSAAAAALRATVRVGLVTFRVSEPMSMPYSANASMPLCSAAYLNRFSIRQRARSQNSSPAGVAVASLVNTSSTGPSCSTKVSWRAGPSSSRRNTPDRSWPARYSGEIGPGPVDVDVLVIGTADLDDLEEAARQSEPVLGREVNIRRIRPDVWEGEAAPDLFLASVRSKPLVELDLGRGIAGGA